MYQTIFRILIIVTIGGCFVPSACGISYNIQDFLISNSYVDTMNLYADGDFVVFNDTIDDSSTEKICQFDIDLDEEEEDSNESSEDESNNELVSI